VKLSVIVPALNEAENVAAALAALQPLRAQGHELILVDGGSADGTPALARPWVDRLLVAERGRARQMDAGAAQASGDVLLFLHVDTGLPLGAEALIEGALSRPGKDWGRFDVRLSGAHPLLRVVETLMNWRSALTGIATGDQAIFVRRSAFTRSGGFPDMPLMEDIVLSKRLKRSSWPVRLRQRVVTSSRRWEQQGVLRTVVLMWRLRLAFFLGTDPRLLKRLYDPHTEEP
jgi:rSAM/selenodomain-associated transferase 2